MNEKAGGKERENENVRRETLQTNDDDEGGLKCRRQNRLCCQDVLRRDCPNKQKPKKEVSWKERAEGRVSAPSSTS